MQKFMLLVAFVLALSFGSAAQQPFTLVRSEKKTLQADDLIKAAVVHGDTAVA